MEPKYRQVEESVYQVMRAAFVFAILTPDRLVELRAAIAEKGLNVDGLAGAMLEQMDYEITQDKVIAERAN